MPEHDAAHPAGRQPRLQPGIKPRVRPLEHVNHVVAAAADERVEGRGCAVLKFKRRQQAAFAGFGGVQRDASAGGFQFVQPFPVRREKRPADKGERNLICRRDRRRRRKRAVPVKSRHGFGESARRAGRGGFEQTLSRRAGSQHFPPQPFRRRRAPADGQKKLSQPLQFGAENLPGRRRLPGCRQVEQKGAALSAENRGVKAAPHLVAGRGKNHGGIRPRLGEPDRGLRKRADAGGERSGPCWKFSAVQMPRGCQPVRPDPFGGNPRAGEENVHWDAGFTRPFPRR